MPRDLRETSRRSTGTSGRSGVKNKSLNVMFWRNRQGENEIHQSRDTETDEPGVIVQPDPDRTDLQRRHRSHKAGQAYHDSQREGDHCAKIESTAVPIETPPAVQSGQVDARGANDEV